jgi:glycosyltransferase involved in cell wall biosynthesis
VKHGSKPRVLFIGAFPPEGKQIFGGNVTACRALLGSTFPEQVDLELIDSTQIANPAPSFMVRLVLAIRRLLEFLAKFELRRPDAVVMFVAIGASVLEKGAMAWYARIRGVPALMFPRGGPLIGACERSRVVRWWTRLSFGGARRILCQEKRWQDFSVDTLGFDRQAAPIVTSWTASERLISIGRSRKWGGAPETIRLLFLGWLDREKGIFELLEACRRLAETRKFTLDVVGEGNATVTAREFVEKSRLERVVTFRGWLDGTDLENMFRESDVLILPSWSEGLPNVLIEAMAAKLTVVATSVGTIPDFICDGESGLLIPPRNIRALQEAIELVLSEPKLCQQMADRGHEIAVEKFSVEPAVQRLVAVINETIGCGARS